MTDPRLTPVSPVHGSRNYSWFAGPGSPSVLSNVVKSIEQHGKWINDHIAHTDEHLDRNEWTSIHRKMGRAREHVSRRSIPPQANSWHSGGGRPRQPRVFMARDGVVELYGQNQWSGHTYRGKCDEVRRSRIRRIRPLPVTTTRTGSIRMRLRPSCGSIPAINCCSPDIEGSRHPVTSSCGGRVATTLRNEAALTRWCSGAHASSADSAEGRSSIPQSPTSSANFSRCCSCSPSSSWLERARLKYRCAGSSHVNPIPPWNWIIWCADVTKASVQ